jgi:hypothetical protein
MQFIERKLNLFVSPALAIPSGRGAFFPQAVMNFYVPAFFVYPF